MNVLVEPIQVLLEQRLVEFEFQLAVSLFEDNDDFFGGIEVEQDPLYQFNTHIIYHLRKGRWVSQLACHFCSISRGL